MDLMVTCLPYLFIDRIRRLYASGEIWLEGGMEARVFVGCGIHRKTCVSAPTPVASG